MRSAIFFLAAAAAACTAVSAAPRHRLSRRSSGAHASEDGSVFVDSAPSTAAPANLDTPLAPSLGDASNGSSPSPVPSPAAATCVQSEQPTLLGGLTLPGAIEPVSYDLTLNLPDPNADGIDADAFRFSGRVEGSLVATALTTCFNVHSGAALNVTNWKVSVNGAAAGFEAAAYDEKNMWTVITLTNGTALSDGDKVSYTADFAGIADDASGQGLYRGPNVVASITAGHMLATQMQYLQARRVFPCLDEPSKKALWSAVVTSPAKPVRAGSAALFNTERVANSVKDGRRVETFAQTKVPLAPYLVAFAYGDFDTAEATDKDSGLVHVVAGPKGSAAWLTYALEKSQKIVAAFEKGLAAKANGYTLASMTDRLVHLSSTAMGGAMENLGLIIYNPSYLLVDPKHATLADKQQVTSVMAHEIAHLWFGDYVTTVNWRQLFQNEGMAEFLQYYAMDAVEPEWDIWLGYTGEGFFADYERAMEIDLPGSSSPIIIRANETGVNNPLTYVKGACVNRFLSNFMGSAHYTAGLISYLNKFAEGNANTQEWISHVTGAARNTADRAAAKAIAESHLYQPGFPVVTIDTLGDGKVLLSQKPGSEMQAGLTWSTSLKLDASRADKGVAATTVTFHNETKTAALADGATAAIADPTAGFYGLARYANPAGWAAADEYFQSTETAAYKRMVYLRSVVQLVLTSHEDLGTLVSTTAKMTKTLVSPFDDPAPKDAISKTDAFAGINLILNSWGEISRALAANATLVKEVTDGIVPLIEPAAADLGWNTEIPSPSPTVAPSPSPSPSPNGTNGSNLTGPDAAASAEAVARAQFKPVRRARVPGMVNPRAVRTAAHRDVVTGSSSSPAHSLPVRTRRSHRRRAAAGRSLLGLEDVDVDADADLPLASRFDADAVAAPELRRTALARFAVRAASAARSTETRRAVAVGDDEDDVARAQVLFYAVFFDVKDYAETGAHIYRVYRAENKTVPTDVLDAALWGTVRKGSAKDVDDVFTDAAAAKNTSAALWAQYGFALGGVRADSCARAVEILSDSQLTLELLAHSIRLNPDCSDQMWARFKEIVVPFWKTATERQIRRTPLLSDNFVGAFASEKAYTDLRTFLRANEDVLPSDFVDSILARVLLGVNVLRTNEGEAPFVPPSVTPEPSSSPEPEKGSSNKVIYIVVGVAAGLIALGGVGYFLTRKKDHEAVPGFDSPLVRDSRNSYT